MKKIILFVLVFAVSGAAFGQDKIEIWKGSIQEADWYHYLVFDHDNICLLSVNKAWMSFVFLNSNDGNIYDGTKIIGKYELKKYSNTIDLSLNYNATPPGPISGSLVQKLNFALIQNGRNNIYGHWDRNELTTYQTKQGNLISIQKFDVGYDFYFNGIGKMTVKNEYTKQEENFNFLIKPRIIDGFRFDGVIEWTGREKIIYSLFVIIDDILFINEYESSWQFFRCNKITGKIN
jgi:hypothetical protein